MDRDTERALAGAPEDWRETLAPRVAYLRARHGVLPVVAGSMVCLGPDVSEVFVMDAANEATHAFEFDHPPTVREIASCELAVMAAFN